MKKFAPAMVLPAVAILLMSLPFLVTAQTYTDDVAQIINNNCVTCHREGGIGPMSFETYEQVRPWAPLIRMRVANREMPPYDPNFVQTAEITLKNDIMLHTFLPHMHFRGKSMRATAIYADGTREELIDIPKYDYAWQLSYTWKEPKFIPAGTRLFVEGAFDNSEDNPMNPDPSRLVPWGQMSEDEMFFGAFTWKNL